MPRFQVSLLSLILVPAILFAANWFALSYQVTESEYPLHAKYHTKEGWKLYFPQPTYGAPEIRSRGWPFAYQWGPFPDENLSLPVPYRSFGIKWLPLVLNGLIATAGALGVCGMLIWLVRKRDLFVAQARKLD